MTDRGAKTRHNGTTCLRWVDAGSNTCARNIILYLHWNSRYALEQHPQEFTRLSANECNHVLTLC